MNILKQKTSQFEIPQSDAGHLVNSVDIENSVFTSLAATLTEIRKLKGVRGYILRSNKVAVMDLEENALVVEYAMLSSQISTCCTGIAEQFNFSNVASVLVEGKNLNVLCMKVNENLVSIFMDKTCAHAWIVKRILL